MAKSSGNKGKKEKDSDHNDMTRIEDLSQLIHRDDPELEALFRKATELPELPSEEEQAFAEEPFQEVDSSEENVTSEEDHFTENPPEEESDNSFTLSETDEFVNDEAQDFATNDSEFDSSSFSDSISEEIQPDEIQPEEFVTEDSSDFETNDLQFAEKEFEEEFGEVQELQESPQEIVEVPEALDEKISLQDFQNENIEHNNATSFGHQAFTANPAYSLKIENLDPLDADAIIDVLSDYDLIKSNNERDFRESLKSGALLLSQQSEFLIIHLATRLKKYGGSMIMGPSDKVFTSKVMGTASSRGKITKRIKEQSKKGSDILFHEKSPQADQFSIYMVGEAHDLEILHDYGPIYATEVIDEDDLIRTSFAQKSLEQKEKIQNDEIPLFEEYSEIIDQKKSKLQNILQAKALALEANTIINMQFLMNTQSVKRKTLLILTAEARALKTEPTQVVSKDEQEVDHEL